MREIKFRFWVDGANGEFMIYPDNRENSGFNSEGWGFYLDHEGFEIINHRGVVEPAHHVPMQYTGLKDKNGAEIYEGDIVKRTHLFNGGYGETHTGEVVYDKDYARYVISRPQKHIEPKNEDIRSTLSDKSTYEVIGNIYEDQELLEEI